MKSSAIRSHRHLAKAAIAAIGLLLAATCALAQTIYRSVDGRGRVTFSDTLPPVHSTPWRIVGQPGLGVDSNITAPAPAVETPLSVAASRLPPAIQLVVGRYPVTLLTSADCARCAQGRSLLLARGVPFAEIAIATAGDLEQMRNQTGKATLPVLTVGGLPVKDFSAQEWNAFLDAAGYPKTSALPVDYKNPAPVAWKPVASAPAAARGEPPFLQPGAKEAARSPTATDPQSRLVPLPPADNPARIAF